MLPHISSNLPKPQCGKSFVIFQKHNVRFLFGFASDGVYQAKSVAGICGALLPHLLTFSISIKDGNGSLFSSALSVRVEIPSPGVTRRRFSVKPGLSSPFIKMQRPSDFFDLWIVRLNQKKINHFLNARIPVKMGILFANISIDPRLRGDA